MSEEVNKGKSRRKLGSLSIILIFLGVILFYTVVYPVLNQSDYKGEGLEARKAEIIVDVIRAEEMKKEFGGAWFHLGEPLKLIHNLTIDETSYIYVWNPRKDFRAPYKGWLTMENPFYRISVNLDRSYYLLFDKINCKDVLVYDDKVKDSINMVTGSDIGFSDHGEDNPSFFVTTAIHDVDGIGGYQIHWEDSEKGFLLVGTEGWDFQPEDPSYGYDVEAEVLFGLFADKPYFIDASEFNNLQRLGLSSLNIPYKDPDEVVKSWVITGEYDSGSIRGGDLDHLNAEWWMPWYEVQNIVDVYEISYFGRKAWYFGSGQFSKMFPTHKLIGQRTGGGIVFSLPEGRFRFDDSFGIYGDQVVGESLLAVEGPLRAVSFSVDSVNEYGYFYDGESFREEDLPVMAHICEKYDLSCPDRPLDYHDWENKRFAYVITLANEWYNPNTNQPYDGVWELADEGLEDFKLYEDAIYEQMEKTEPLLLMGKRASLMRLLHLEE